MVRLAVAAKGIYYKILRPDGTKTHTPPDALLGPRSARESAVFSAGVVKLAKTAHKAYALGMVRIGTGYDIHRVAPGGPLILGGVRIDCPFHLLGHSDADAVLHALTDAILGALAAGDIGDLFPDTDPKYAGADSAAFLAAAMALATKANYRVENCDVTIVAERPKLSAHKRAMQERIANLLGVPPTAVGVKAKTNEGLGPVGAGEAIAVLAAVLLTGA